MVAFSLRTSAADIVAKVDKFFERRADGRVGDALAVPHLRFHAACQLVVTLGPRCLLALNGLRFRLREKHPVAVSEEVDAPGAIEQSKSQWRTLAWLGGVVFAVFAVTESYTPAAHANFPPDVQAFYPDLTMPLVASAVFGLLTLFVLNPRNHEKLVRYGVIPYRIACGLAPVLAGASLAMSTLIYIEPTPQVEVTQFDLDCNHKSIPWSMVADISLVSGGKWHEYAQLTLDPHMVAGQAATVSCEIDGTTAGYNAVYDAIRTAWLADQNPPAGDPDN